MDIDIDLQTTFDPKVLFKGVIPASMIKNDTIVKHPCGYYFQTMPVDPPTGLAAIPYDRGDDFGFFKIDFLHLSLLDMFSSKTEIRELLAKSPNWKLLEDPDNIGKLFHLHKHANLVRRVRPTSVIELADCLALIRPGKRELLEQYLRDRHNTRVQLYARSTDEYYFKKSHAISYALTIVLQLHLIELGRL